MELLNDTLCLSGAQGRPTAAEASQPFQQSENSGGDGMAWEEERIAKQRTGEMTQ